MKGKSKRGRPPTEKDVSYLFNGVWITLALLDRYWQLRDHASPGLHKFLEAYRKVIAEAVDEWEALSEAKPPKPVDQARLVLVRKYQKKVAALYGKAKAKALGRDGLTRELAELLRPERLPDHAAVVSRLAAEPFRVPKEDEHEPMMRGKSELALYALHRALGLPSPRNEELKSEATPPTVARDTFSLEALKSLLLVSGYSRKTADRVISLLEDDDQFFGR